MTASDQFDPFERRITEAIDEIAAARTPLYLDDILRLTARASQRRKPALWRPPSMTRLSYAAAAAVITLVLAGGALIVRNNSTTGGPPSAAPSPTIPARPTTVPAAAPAQLRSTWLADAGPTASAGGSSAFLRLVVSAAGDQLSVVVGGIEKFKSSPVAGAATEFDFTSTSPVGGCQIGDLGRYGFAFGSDGTVPGSDGTLLALTVIEDACAARATILNRGWVHAISADSNGGRGVATAFTPMFLITMPPARYVADVGIDSLMLTSTTPDRTLITVKNPAGWNDPCSGTGGTKRPIAHTIAAFSAYMGTLPGFTVQQSNLTIDGHPAALLTIPSAATADCPSHKVFEWSASSPTAGGAWFLAQGDTDVVYLVEVDGNLILMQWLGASVSRSEEQALFATVHFTNTLPQ